MRINRKTVTVGVATLALVGLTGGGVAWATTGADEPSSDASGTFQCGGYGMPWGEYSPMSAVADYLGLTRTELVDRMHSGQSLADIALAQGKTVAGLKSAMVSAMERSLAADSDLTAAQRTAMLTLMKSHLDAMVDSTRMGGFGGMDADDMGSMMGGSGMMGGRYGGGMMGRSGDGSRGFGYGMMGD